MFGRRSRRLPPRLMLAITHLLCLAVFVTHHIAIQTCWVAHTWTLHSLLPCLPAINTRGDTHYNTAFRAPYCMARSGGRTDCKPPSEPPTGSRTWYAERAPDATPGFARDRANMGTVAVEHRQCWWTVWFYTGADGGHGLRRCHSATVDRRRRAVPTGLPASLQWPHTCYPRNRRCQYTPVTYSHPHSTPHTHPPREPSCQPLRGRPLPVCLQFTHGYRQWRFIHWLSRGSQHCCQRLFAHCWRTHTARHNPISRVHGTACAAHRHRRATPAHPTHPHFAPAITRTAHSCLPAL